MMQRYSLYILLAALVLLILLAISGAAHVYGAPPASARATFTPIAEVTPAPTYAPPAYPAPGEPTPTPRPSRPVRQVQPMRR